MMRYTLTVYKFPNIGIVVRPTSHVEITICDNRDNHIILSHPMRKAFIERHADWAINVVNCPIITNNSSFKWRICQNMWYEKHKIVIVWYFCMKLTIVLFLFELDQCIEYVYYKLLSQHSHGVSGTFKYFLSFLRQNYVTNECNAKTLCTKFMIRILL